MKDEEIDAKVKEIDSAQAANVEGTENVNEVKNDLATDTNPGN